MGTHGVLEKEQMHPQPFEFDLDVRFDMGPAAHSDQLDDTVDYAALIDAAAGVITGPWCALLERLAWLMGSAVLAVDTRVASVDVVVRKLEPPVDYDMASAGVRVSVSR